ncbi:MAG TPA: metal-dependent hydrolase [Candidatus Eremiobacteraceae bacterium]|nr:metal-dependent hydrolase [Candidatus Eremiobacteraceae bacterium]
MKHLSLLFDKQSIETEKPGETMLDTKGNRITYFGHSTFSLTTPSGQVALIDPWVATNPVCPTTLKNISRLDAIFLTHAHTDHFGDLFTLAKQFHPKIVAIFETCLYIAEKGYEKQICPMGKGGAQIVGDFQVTMTHAFHSNSIDDNGIRIYAGEPAGLVIRLPGDFTIYHAGDTAVFGDMKLIGQLYRPDLAMLPIGDLYTMGPREAAYAIRLLGVKHIVPMHYATFPVLTGTPDALRKETREIEEITIHALQPGQILD